MKKLIYMIAILAAFFVSSCDEDSPGSFADSQVKIESSDVTFSSEGGTGTIVLAPSKESVAVTSDKDWCKPSLSGNTVTVTCTANNTMFSRTALITLRAGEKVNYVPVTQYPLYIQTESNEVLLMGGECSVSVPYSSPVAVTATSEASWAKATVSNGNIVISVAENPASFTSRTTKVKVVAGDNLAMAVISVVQCEGITGMAVPSTVNSISNFLNLMNNGTTSRYKITSFSAPMAKYYNSLLISFPQIKEFRIETPRGSHKLSLSMVSVLGATESTWYFNAPNGLVALGGSKSSAYFAVTGYTYAGVTAPYSTDPNYEALRDIIVSIEGYTIIPTTNNVFWFRSNEDPRNYFKAEPATW